MENCNILGKNVKIHFIGIGGVGMSALAKYALKIGMIVSGSDLLHNKETQILEDSGAKIFYNHLRSNAKGKKIVVYNSAIRADNPEFEFAKDNKKILLKRSELLGLILSKYNTSVAISGCHGKTTTTAMLAHILMSDNLSVTAFIGGEDKVFSNFIFGENICVTEACEYQKNILDLFPKIAVVNNIDNDHMDCYKNLEELKATYKKFIEKTITVINIDDKNSKDLVSESSITTGIDSKAMFLGKYLKEKEGVYSFVVYEKGKKLGKINLAVAGKYNVYNALSAISVARLLGVSYEKIETALNNFNGVARRNEFLGAIKKTKLYADYAHHPKEIASTLELYGKKNTYVIFQPHTFSRTKLLMNEFIESLKDYNVLIYSSYSAREVYDADGSSFTLFNKLKSKSAFLVDYAENKIELFKKLDEIIDKTANFLFLGAGNIYELAKEYIKNY